MGFTEIGLVDIENSLNAVVVKLPDKFSPFEGEVQPMAITNSNASSRTLMTFAKSMGPCWRLTSRF